MYYLVIEIHHLRQLEKLEPELIRNIFSELDETATDCGMERQSHDMRMYRRIESGGGNFDPLISALLRCRQVLEGYAEELAGYTLILEAEEESGATADFTGMLYRVRERDGMYLGPNAEKLIAHQLVGERFRGLWKVISARQQDDRELGTAIEFALHGNGMDEIIDGMEEWISAVDLHGEFRIRGGELDGSHVAAKAVMQRLNEPAAIGKTLFAVVNGEDMIPSLIHSINLDDADWVEDQLQPSEVYLWKIKRYALWHYSPRQANPAEYNLLNGHNLPSDALLALEMYLVAYARWAESRGNQPLAVFHINRSLTEGENSFLKRLMENSSHRMIWLFSGDADVGSGIAYSSREMKLQPLDDTNVRNLHKKLCREESSSGPMYMARSTESRALPLYYYLRDCAYFSSLLPGRLTRQAGVELSSAQGIVLRSIERFPQDARDVLAIMSAVGSFMGREMFAGFLEYLGKNPIRTAEILKEFLRDGVAYHEELSLPAFQSIPGNAFTGTIDEQRRIYQSLVEYLEERAPEALLNRELIQLLAKIFPDAATTRLLYRKILVYIESGLGGQARQIIEVLGNSRDQRIARNLLRDRINIEAGIDAEGMPLESVGGDDFWNGEWHINSALRSIRNGQREEAQNSAKRAIILHQQTGDSDSLAISNLLFGFLQLCRSNHHEAVKYFSIASRTVQANHQGLPSLLAILMTSISDYLEGKYSEVRKALEGPGGLIRSFESSGLGGWTITAGFILARTYFAMGMYEQARMLFTRMLNDTHDDEYRNLVHLLYGWTARCMMYEGKYRGGDEILANLPFTEEIQAYQAESYILRGEAEYALSTLAKETEVMPDLYAISPLFVWKNGYSWLEDIFTTDDGVDVCSTFLHGLRAYARGLAGDYEESIETFHWLTRQRRIPVSDPHLSTILYWYSLITESNQSPDGEDRLTLLGRAVKALQERSSRIAEPSDKREYLKQVKWNRELLEKAKRFNLV